ncbi:methyl-accepting chemotaxis protein [Rhodoferax sp. U11-2br]|uniref:methyl-accepting chemotaxis protein n=1 Tax=Rhodoferax sp. U11-2br TaxID=2838878 RepID=UPI001BECE938|nr:methyl-accepting chemotaxis protein [Rhodoferax sp. U11-2br]MBT3067320.1 MCP four helix bundle domain-containing protein [Rhodoferax sp. U11-2br]
MKFLSGLSVMARLTVTFGALLILLFASAGLALLQQQQSARAMDQLVSSDLEKLRLTETWKALSQETTVRLMAVNRSTDPALAQLFGPEIGPLVKAVGAMFNQIREVSTSEEEKAWFDAMTPKREALLKSLGQMAELRKSGDVDGAVKAFDEGFVPAQKSYNEHIAAFSALQRSLMDAKVAEVKTQARQRALWQLGIAVVLGLLGLWMALGVTRHIKHSLDAAVSVARAVAGGDLSQQPQVQGHDEFAELMRNMGEMTSSLERIVYQVRQGTNSIATASTEISQGNNDLSHRTEQQASNVQQVASAMDEITQSVRQNADHARQANTLSQEASLVAQRGGEAVSRVVTTMSEINSASHRIEEIIAVIDGIAFQTNILALNAAVEAARAGEQGRGFAVVAGEVRTLAQRSAQAAKEIKTLISDSSDKVRVGSEQVEGAGRTMDDIMQAVKRVSALVSQISEATEEQGRGITHVGDSVSEIDQMTQQNAALVEQAAAAADSMRRQAQELEQAVSVFHLASTVGTRPLLR